MQSSYREVPSVVPPSSQDHLRVAHERPRERTQRDDPTPSDTERRNPPRDTERSLTTSRLSASAPPPTFHTRRVFSSRGGGQSTSDVSQSLGSRATTYDVLFPFVRLHRMDIRTLIMDPVFSPVLLFVSPFPPMFLFRAKVTCLVYSWLSGIRDYPTFFDQAFSAGFGSTLRCEKGPFLPRRCSYSAQSSTIRISRCSNPAQMTSPTVRVTLTIFQVRAQCQICLHREKLSTQVQGQPLLDVAEVIPRDLPAKLQPPRLKVGTRVG